MFMKDVLTDQSTYKTAFKHFAASRRGGQAGMLKGRGRYWRVNGRLYVYVPSKVGNDSQCPLTEEKGDVIVRIEKNRVIVEKA
jgi:hypothetical protein